MAGEDIDTEFFLELNDRFGDARLGRKQRLGGFRQIELLPDGLANKAELMKIHGLFPDTTSIVFIKASICSKNQGAL
jgi:hypothetical protein